MRERADEARRAPLACEREPRSADSTPARFSLPILPILSPWLSIRSRMPRLDTGFSSMSVVMAIFRHELFGSPCATSRCSMARVGDGCSDLRTVSGIAENASGGCRRTLPAGSSAHRAGITTWDATAIASSAASDSIGSPRPSPLALPPEGGREVRFTTLFQRVRLRPPDAAGQCRCQRHQRGEQPQPPPDRPLLATQ